MTQPFLYRWTHIPSKKWYIGSRTAKGCHINDSYICSSKQVRPLIKNNPEEWKREILCIGEPDYIKELEIELLKLFEVPNNLDSFNKHIGGGKFSGSFMRTPEILEKMSKNLKGRIPWNKGLKGVQQAWNKGIPRTEEVKKAVSKARIGKKTGPRSLETKIKIGLGHKGKIVSNETREKLRTAGLAYYQRKKEQ
jgi:hypothetical protein